MDLIGKEWYFVRVHDAVQTCLQYVQSLNGSPKTPEELESDYKPNLFHRFQKQRTEDFTSSELESGIRQVSIFKETNPSLEPLLQRKPWKNQTSQNMYSEVHYGAVTLYILDHISYQDFWFDLIILYSKLDDIQLGILVLVPNPVCIYYCKITDFICKWNKFFK